MKWIVFSFLFIGSCLAKFPTEIPDLDDFEAIKERCDKKGGAGAYEKVKNAREETKTCLQGLVDVSKLKDEVEEAKKTGSMDEVFGRYCDKKPQVKICLNKTYQAVEPCLEDNEIKAINITANILNQISDFVCFKDGDRIAMFVAEGGVECLQSRTEGIKNCFNETIKFNPSTFSMNSLPNLAMDKKKCDDIKTIQECVVKDLEDNCSDSTPANIVDALFRFVKKAACKDIKKRSISSDRYIHRLVWRQGLIKSELFKIFDSICRRNDENSFASAASIVQGGNITQCLIAFDTSANNSDQLETFNVCKAEIRRAVENCLLSSETYLLDFIFKVYIELFKVYKDNINIRQSSPQEAALCYRTIFLNKEVHAQLRECIDIVRQEFIYTNNINFKKFALPTKDDLCKKLDNVGYCIDNVVKNNCIPDVTIHNLYTDIMNAIKSPCTEN